MLEEEQKICSKCLNSKSIKDFYKESRTGNYRKKCKECFCLQTRINKIAYRSRQEIIEREKDYQKEYMFRSHVVDKRKEYRNKPQIKESVRVYNQKYRSIPEKKEKIQHLLYIFSYDSC